VSSTPGQPGSGQPPADDDGQGLAVAAYVALFVLGAVLGLLGTFHYSQGPAPFAAIGFDLAILATCVLGSWGTRTGLGGLLPAAGWLLVTLVLSTAPAGGSILVTASLAGEWFLFGGAVAAVGGAVYAYARWSRPRRDGTGGRSGRRPGPR
jgi:uncharacterized membrane protein